MAETLTVMSTPLPTTKAEWLAYSAERWRAFVACTDALSDAEWTEPTDAGGWSIKDHVAHLVVWMRTEIALLRYRTPLQQSLGIPDAVWNTAFATGDFAPLNEEVRQKMIGESPAAVRAERDRVYQKLVEVVSRFSDDDVARPATEFGLDEPGKSLLAVLTEYYGSHWDEHRGYVERIIAQG
jgi:hypothetical protein